MARDIESTKPINSPQTKRQSGASLTEYLLYAALAGLVVVGATKMYSSSNTSSQSNQLLSDLQGIRSGAQTISNSGIYTGISLDNMSTAKALPSTIRKSGTNWLSNLNTNMTLAVNASTPSKFDLVINSVPPEVCMKTLSSLDASWSAKVGSTAVTLPASDVNTIASACGSAAVNLTLTSS